VDAILSHPWFAGLDSDQVISKTYMPEFKPKLSKDMFDVSNFDKQFTREEAAISVLPMQERRKIA